MSPSFPRAALFAAAALILFALAAVTTVRLTGVGDVTHDARAAVESRDLRFEDGKNGAVLVFDASNQQLVDTLAPGSNGFIRVRDARAGARTQARRHRREPPFRLTRYATAS